jgi:hypothetical protein
MNTSANPDPASSGVAWRIIGWSGAAALLAAPLVATQFTPEMAWNETDFIVLGLLIASVGGLMEFAVRLSSSWFYRTGFAVAVLGGFLMVWSNLAVGIVGNEDNPFNFWFFGVLAVGLLGALVASGEAGGMALTMGIMGALQVGLFALASAIQAGEPWPAMLFLPFWLGSAALFARADFARLQAR